MAQKNKTKARAGTSLPVADERAATPSPPVSALQLALLKLLVFVAGAVLMALEIAGSRVLAPHFGNSVFVWGSLISVFLVALSLGYYGGGRVADKHPSWAWLNAICVAVSLAILVMSIFAHRFCGWLVDCGLGEQSGPLIATMALFLVPSVGLGMVSPYAIRLATESVASVGRVSGSLYAISTAGSIAGTLSTTFVLVPLFGVAAIIKGLGIVLLITSLVTLPLGRRALGPLGMLLVAIAALGFAAVPELRAADIEGQGKILLKVDTPYHSISVAEDGNRRMLRFDRYVESMVLTYPPYRSQAPYTDYFHLAFLVNPNIHSALFIGAGGGIGPRTFRAQNPEMEIDVVDIDQKVLDIAHDHFFLESDQRLHTTAMDGRMFLRKSTQHYDCLVLDAFSTGGRIPFHLVTREFMQLCHDHLTPDGVFVMNIVSALKGPEGRIFQSVHRTLKEVFPNVYVFALSRGQASSDDSMNVILVATVEDEPIKPAEWSTRLAHSKGDAYFSDSELRSMIRELHVTTPVVEDAPIFTDDYAPIETMPF